MLLRGVVGRDPRRKDRRGEHERHERERHDGAGALTEPEPRAPPPVEHGLLRQIGERLSRTGDRVGDGHDTRTLGLTYAYAMSTTMLTNRTTAADTSTTAWMMGTSRFCTAASA